MESEQITATAPEVTQLSRMNTVTPLSKYLAMALFVALPFIGGYVGYELASERVVEVEKIVYEDAQLNKSVVPTEEQGYEESSDTDNVTKTMSGAQRLEQLAIYDFTGKYETFPFRYNYKDMNPKGDSYHYSAGDGAFYVNSEKIKNGFSEEGILYLFRLRGQDMATEENSLIIRDDIDTETYQRVSYYYSKDKNGVYFLPEGGLPPSKDRGPLVLNPLTVTVDGFKDELGAYIADEKNIYHAGVLLEGIDVSQMNMDGYGNVYDNDTVWLNDGDCHFTSYTRGTFEDLEAYKPRC